MRFLALLDSAIDASRFHYREAVALEVEGHPERAHEHWGHFQGITAGALTLGALLGEEKVFNYVRVLSPPDAEPFQRPDEVGFGFEVGPFEAAIKSFQGKVPRTREEVDALRKRASRIAEAIAMTEKDSVVAYLEGQSTAVNAAIQNSFWTSDTDTLTTVNLRNLVGDAIRGNIEVVDLNLPQFIDQAQLMGASGLTDARLEVIYRNNLNNAWNAGQARALSSAPARKVTPLVILSNPKDSRSREVHAAVSGYVNTIDLFESQGIVPANGHNCRCGMRPISTSEALGLGLVTPEGSILPEAVSSYNGARQLIIDRGEYPDEGWIT